MDDDELIRRGQAGDESALVELYRRYRPRLYGFVLRMTGDRDLAEEIFSATFARLLERLDRYRPQGQFAAYLFRIARNQLADEFAKRNRSRPHPDLRSLDDLPEPKSPDPAMVATELELAELVEGAVARLPEHLREVVLLRVYDGQHYASIGQILGIPEVTARSRMRYALQFLRQALPGHNESE